jgi:Repeat of unknown function (DUF5650)
MKITLNHSQTIVGARGLALCLAFFMMLMSVLPMIGQAQATIIAPGAITSPTATMSQIDIVGPAGSGRFGTSVTALPNGNIVVTDFLYDITSPVPVADVGAVYLYNGATGALISTLTGSTANDLVGNGGVTVLSNGNYVVNSSSWNGSRGAVTWGNGATGINGVVSAANSLVGSSVNDSVGLGEVTALTNGNYVVQSPDWNHLRGAATWGNGATGISGVVSAANSLVGSSSDSVGSSVTALTNGNYVVGSPEWQNGSFSAAGAATWGNGATGISGVVSPANSLVGSTSSDFIGDDVIALANGNYVVRSPLWNNGAITEAGAATWGNGATGINGVISAANSLVGSTAFDFVGSSVTALTNSNYVVGSSGWHNGPFSAAGAATWGNGATGISGPVSAANSLVGTSIDDEIGTGVTALTNGNYIVRSPLWNNGAITQAGAATWGNGTTGISGPVSVANSLVGTSINDRIGTRVTALTNGNYVVRSPDWNNGAAPSAGAVTWGNGATGTSGPVSAANSLVGSIAFDAVGSQGVTALTNGNYVVISPFWTNGAITQAGAATWGNGTTGISGPVSPSNSLVGSISFDQVGSDGVTALSNGNYVVTSQFWKDFRGAATWGNGATGISGPASKTNSLVGSTLFNQVGIGGVTALTNGNYVVNSWGWANGAASSAGAVTWGNGATGISGAVSAANSLVGSAKNDFVGIGGVTALANSNYIVSSPGWNNGAIVDAGAITYGIGDTGFTVGPITAANSVRGTAPHGGPNMIFAYDSVNRQLVVGRPDSNIVTLFRMMEFMEFDVCLQDDSNPNTSVAFNTLTGDYIFCAGGTQYTGTGTVTRRGNTTTLQHNAGDRRVQVNVDTSANRATGSFQKLGAGGGTFSLTDRDIRNDTCSCVTQ